MKINHFLKNIRYKSSRFPVGFFYTRENKIDPEDLQEFKVENVKIQSKNYTVSDSYRPISKIFIRNEDE